MTTSITRVTVAALPKRTQPFRPSCSQRGTLVKPRLDEFVRLLLLSWSRMTILRCCVHTTIRIVRRPCSNRERIDDLHKRLNALVSQMETLTGAAHAAITKRVQALGEDRQPPDTTEYLCSRRRQAACRYSTASVPPLPIFVKRGSRNYCSLRGNGSSTAPSIGRCTHQLKDRELRLVI